MKVAAAIQNAIQCYWAINDKKKKKEIPPRNHWAAFFKRVDRIELSKEPERVPSTSGVSETAACPSSVVADNPSALPALTSFPSCSQQLFLPVHSMPAPVCQVLNCTTVLFKVLDCKNKKGLFLHLFIFMYYLCEKYYKPITIQYWLC